MALSRLKSRIGAVRSLLESLQGQPELLASTSTAQSASLAKAVLECASELTEDQVATLQLKLHALPWEASHLATVLGALAHGDGSAVSAQAVTAPKKPRKLESMMQDYMNWHFYITDVEWDKFDELADGNDAYAIANMIIEIICSRMWCCNPSEPCLKFLASCALALTFKDVDALSKSMAEKVALRDHVRKDIKGYWKTQAKPFEHCLKLPKRPRDLAGAYPLLHVHITTSLGGALPEGSTRLPMTVAQRISQSFKCRNNIIHPMHLSTTASAPNADAMGMQRLMQMQMQMMMPFLQNMQNPSGEGGIQLDFMNGAANTAGLGSGSTAKRSLGALQNAFQSQPAWKRGRVDFGGPGAALDDAQLPPRPALPPPPAQREAQQGTPPRPALPPPPAQSEAVLSMPAQSEADAHAELPGEVAVPDMPEPEKEGSNLIDALIARDAQTKLEAAEKKKEAAAEKAAERARAKATAVAAKVAEKADAKAAVVAAKCAEKAKGHAAVAVAKSSVAPKKVPTAVDNVAKPVAAPAKSGVKPSLPTTNHSKASYSHETTRFQFLCRTGKKGAGQSHAIRYHPKTDLTQKDAETQAKAWLSNRASLAGA